MLRNIYIMMGVLSISALMQGAAENREVQPAVDRLSYCFKSEKLPALGKARSYVPVIVSKRFEQAAHPRFGQFTVSEGAKCDILVGCVGIVDGSDAASTEKVAAKITKLAMEDTSWIPVRCKSGHDAAAIWHRKLEEMYLSTALAIVTNRSLEHYATIRDTSLSLVWFQSEKNKPEAIDLSTQYTSVPLRELIVPASIEKDRAFLGECLRDNSIEHLAECTKSVSVSHEATVLRLIPEQLKAFIAQELEEQAN